MSMFNADSLNEMFSKVEQGETTIEKAAEYHGRSVSSINNYFYAKKAYENGREVNAQNISTKVFSSWATKYGKKGEPIYRPDPNPNRKHVKKQPEQQKINLDEVHDETKPGAVDNPTEEECIHHFKVARKATAICAIMLSCEHFSIEDGVVNMRMPFHVFSNLADHYKGSDE